MEECNLSETSRRFRLAFNLDLIDGYERDQMRTRDLNPCYSRTPEQIRRECDVYRREAHRVFGFPSPNDDMPLGTTQCEASPDAYSRQGNVP